MKNYFSTTLLVLLCWGVQVQSFWTRRYHACKTPASGFRPSNTDHYDKLCLQATGYTLMEAISLMIMENMIVVCEIHFEGMRTGRGQR